MWYTLTALERKGKPAQYVNGLLFCWTGNLVGALFFSGIMTYFTKALSEEPWRSGVGEQVTEDIVEKEWHVIFLRAVGCGFLVSHISYIHVISSSEIWKPESPLRTRSQAL